jgi:hypothetical protein
MKRTLLSLALLCGTVGAQTVPVPPAVVSVQTVGHWRSNQAAGSYRIVVTREGWEHVWSRVFVEWLSDPSDREVGQEPPHVVELIPPLAQGTAVFEATARQRKPNELIVTVFATSNMEVNAKKQHFVFAAGVPGTVQLLRGAARK